VAIIIPANSAADTAYEVANSCRFNDGDAGHLHFTPSSAGDLTEWTLSLWFKRGTNFGAEQRLFGGVDAGTHLFLNTSDQLKIGLTTDSGDKVLLTNRKFRDPSAWYHVVIAYNSDEGTTGNRIRMYINGTEETSFSTETQPASGENSTVVNDNSKHDIGYRIATTSMAFDGYMAEIVFIDGDQLTPTSFGKFNSDSPTIWQPIDVSGLTFGSQGYHLDFENSAALGNDVSGNNNDWTVVSLAAVDQATDTPTNNFCTMHPLNASSYVTLSEGNNTVFGNTSSGSGNVSGTICPDGGKWYAETKYRTIVSNYPRAGQFQINTVFGRSLNSTAGSPGNLAYECQMTAAGAMTTGASETGGWGSSVSAGGIVQIAIDCDNGATYIGINNTWQDSGDPTSGASKTGAATTWTPATHSQGATFGDSCYNGSYSDWNFGANGAFAGTAVSSAASDANGYGAFEYAPPSGYLALCTKNLGSDGG